MIIRKEKESDIDHIKNIDEEIVSLENDNNGFFFGAYPKKEIKCNLDEFYVLEIDNTIVSYARVIKKVPVEVSTYITDISKCLYLSDIATRPKYFYKGYASKLIKHFAKSNDLVSFVYIYPRFNKTSIKFHLKLNFNIINTLYEDSKNRNALVFYYQSNK